MLYKLGLLNRPELNKVYHSFYNLFLGRIQGVKIGGVSENTLSNIIYRIRVLQELKNCKIEEVSGSIIRFYVMIG
jgi:hypothetical protein